ncbi:MAG: pilus assembly protein [Actinomycetia bacterium]|nr:pilus assembly protein [Actinomycetes bacterium]
MISPPVVALGSAVGCVYAWARARRVGMRHRAVPLRTPGSRQLPAGVRAPLAHALDAAMIPCSPEDAVIGVLTAAGVAGLVGAALIPFLAPLLVVLVLVGGPAGLHLSRGRRDHALVGELPGLMQRVAFELAAGASLEQSIAGEADRSGPLAADLDRVRARVRHGLPLTDALARWVAGRDVPEVRAVAGAFGIAVESGAPAASALHGLARGLRDRRSAEAESRIHSVQARLSAWVVGAAPLGFLVVSTVADPRTQSATFGTEVGRACLICGLALELVAVLWIRRIVAVPR